MNRFIFLDIDGPVIPTGCYFVNRNASFDRTFSNVCIGYVKKLLDLSGAKLVTNSMHNYHPRIADDGETFTLRDDLVNAGIPLNSFHDIWRTQFGHFSFNNNSWRGDQPHPRLKAINEWLDQWGGENPEWIGFDDEPYKHDNQFIVNFDDGITWTQFTDACKKWNLKVPFVL